MKLLHQGAEAKIFEADGFLIKKRTKKSYRVPELDLRLRKSRTKREMKILSKLASLDFPAPKHYNALPESLHINLERIPGKKLRDVLNKSNAKAYGKEIGHLIAIMHNNEMIHGDLTTSNMIVHKKLFFIDFGLSAFTKKVEDFAVDLHLLRQALESYHSDCWDSCYTNVINTYKKEMKSAKEVLTRLEKVELRGRYKGH